MVISTIEIENYKSLKHVEVHPSGLTALVGPNGAGKSNFADALHFLTEVYRHGLETAIARKGGFENIAFRRTRRTKGRIRFRVEADFSPKESLRGMGAPLVRSKKGDVWVRVVHTFSFRARSRGIEADFAVDEETLCIISYPPASWRKPDPRPLERVRIDRMEPFYPEVEFPGGTHQEAGSFGQGLAGILSSFGEESKVMPVFMAGEQQLLMVTLVPHRMLTHGLAEGLSNFAVFHFSPEVIKGSGIPTPSPTMSRAGENLPAVVDWLKRTHPETWANVLHAMRELVPGLEDISVEYIYNKAMGIFFLEQGFGRGWRSDEVSDGTIHTLSMLVALADPRNSGVLIDEPENSIHPWIIRVLVNALRETAKVKTVVIATHSPYVIDMLTPEEAWIVRRKRGATELNRLTELDPDIAETWAGGDIRLSEYLDAGLLPAAVPGGVT